MEPHWRVSCVLEECAGRIVWRPGQPSRWLDEQRATRTDTTLWLDVIGRWERVQLREVCVP
jgi:hypothetical protein